MAPERPIIALLTDFGLQDHYVAAMKGVMLTIASHATFVDITHQIPPQDILGGSLELEAVHRYFPRGTVFLAVVDPGVGTTRRPLVATAGDYGFVGPDNGLLWPALEAAGGARAVELTAPRFQRPTISRTFEGRDRFAPAAAWLALETPLEEFGPIASPLPLTVPVARQRGGSIVGEVVRVDRFGNLVTNIDRALLGTASPHAVVEIDGKTVGPVVATFGSVAAGSPCAFVGSSERLEVAINGDSAERRFGVGRGALVRVGSSA